MIEQLNPVTRDRSLPVTPQLAMRVAMLGVAAFVLFAIVFFRLWYLQVLSGDQYRVQANDNRVRNLRISAPRGTIVDRNSTPLVTSRQATVIQISPSRLPLAERTDAFRWETRVVQRDALPKGHHGLPIAYPAPATPQLAAEFQRLGKVIGLSPQRIQERIVNQLVLLPYAAVTIKVDVPASERNYLLERQTEFPSIDPPALAFVRDYPKGDLAAQLMGTIGQISPHELHQPAHKGVAAGTVIGQSGIEAQYDHYLRGITGVQRYVVDAQGNPKGNPVTPREPAPGDQIQLTLDAGLQRAGQSALAQGMRDAASFGNFASAGAFVAMDPRNGQILALGSAPTYNPSELARSISESHYKKLISASGGFPLINRAVSSVYPTGSTFKPITAMAALTAGVITPSTPIDDPGCVTIAKQTFCDAGSTKDHPIPGGSVNLVDALRVSSDVYFYELGARLNGLPHQKLQYWADHLGLGAATGIDVPGEASGTVPDAAWRARQNAKELACERKEHRYSCGIAISHPIEPWTVGDEIQLATGQGDLQASPLQMAVAYSTLANGGTVVRPHLAKDLQDSEGRELQQIATTPVRHVALNPTYRNLIMEGLHEAASQPGGTSADVFKDWNQSRYPVYGKTGTAQRFYGSAAVEHDQSWYVAYSYDVGSSSHRPIVIAMTIEKGGFGAQAAAPAVCLMLNRWFGQHSACTPQNSKTR